MNNQATLDALDEIIVGFQNLRASLDGSEEEDTPKRGRKSKADRDSEGVASGRKTKAKAESDEDADEAPARNSGNSKAATSKSAKGKSKAVTFEEVQNAAKELVEAQDTAALKAVLKELGVKKVSEIEEDDYKDALAKIQEALEDNQEDLFDEEEE